MNRKSIISIDMGGTKVLACVINSKKGIVARLKKPTNTTLDAQQYVNSLAKIINNLINTNKINRNAIKAVCLGIPGSLNPVSGKIGLAPNLGLKNYNIRKNLEKAVSFPVLIENDANLGTLGIKYFGVGKKAKNLLAVFIGTGIGAGLIINGKLYRGSDFVAGEIGHMPVERDGPKCGCGKIGCFEAVASRTAIAKKIISDLESGKESYLSNAHEAGKQIKSKLLLAAVNKNDKVVCKRIREASNTMGEVLAGIANLLNLDTIVLAGGLIEALGFFMIPEIKKSFKMKVLADAGENIKIVSSKLDDDAAIFGGLPLADEFLNIKI